ncbi:GSCOCG00012550001-RA-CDS, partial [Cotesia congregata]
TWRGVDPTILLRLYKALIRSRLEYRGFLFHPLSSKTLKKLTAIQNQALRVAMGYRQSTPINVMLAEAKDPPIYLRYQYLCMNFLTRMLSNSEHPITLLLDKLVANRDNSLLVTRGPRPLLLVACEDLIPIQHYIASTDKPWCYAYSYESLWFVPDVDLDCGISIQESKNPNSKFESLFRQELIRGNCWFTDGSKIPEQEFVGFASVNVSAGAIETCRTVKYASIFTAEAMAIYTTLEKFFQNNEHHFNIFSDSKSVLIALKNYIKPEKQKPIIHVIKDQLQRLSLMNKKVKFYWIPAHMGIEYNEMVDKTAKESALIGIDSHILIPASDLKAIWKVKIKNKFNLWCCNTGKDKGKNYFNKYWTEGASPWFKNFTFCRKTIVSINRLRSGHTSLAASLFRFKIVNSDQCSSGEAVEEPNHVFWQCKLYDKAREYLITDLIKAKIFPP